MAGEKFKNYPGKLLVYSLIHEDTFNPENLNMTGNPSGKDRKATYDTVKKEVAFLFYQ